MDKIELDIETRRKNRKKKTEEIQQRKLLEQLGRQEIEAAFEAETNQLCYSVYFLDANTQIISQKYIGIPEDARQAAQGLESRLDHTGAHCVVMQFHQRVNQLVREKKLSLIDVMEFYVDQKPFLIPALIVQGLEKEINALDYFLKNYQTKEE